MINILKFYEAPQNAGMFSTDPNIWPTEVMLHVLQDFPNEGWLHFPEKFDGYTFNAPESPIVIQRPVVISGGGKQGTIFKLYKSIIIQSPNVTFENLSIERYSSGALDGIISTLSPYTSLRNISFQNFGQKTTQAIQINLQASNWYLENIDITDFRSGIKTTGDFGTCINLSVFGGGEGGAGIDDDSKSGSTYTSCNTSNHPFMGIRCLHKGTFIGCYATDKVEIKKDTLWVGGKLEYKLLSEDTSGTIFTKNAFKQFHNNVKGVQFHKNDNNNDNKPARFFAGGTGSNVIFEFPSKKDVMSSKWALKYDSQESTYKLGLVTSNQKDGTLCFSGGHPTYTFPNQPDSYMSPGKLGFPKGYYLGNGNNFIRVDSSETKPINSGRKGDRMMNRTPIVKPPSQQLPQGVNYMGWICTTSAVEGVGAEWKGFGLLEG